MSANRYSQNERAGAIVTAGMVLLALLGVITVFHEPIATIFAPPASSSEPPPLPPSSTTP